MYAEHVPGELYIYPQSKIIKVAPLAMALHIALYLLIKIAAL